eukprot:gene18546-13352_t
MQAQVSSSAAAAAAAAAARALADRERPSLRCASLDDLNESEGREPPEAEEADDDHSEENEWLLTVAGDDRCSDVLRLRRLPDGDGESRSDSVGGADEGPGSPLDEVHDQLASSGGCSSLT